MNGTANLSLADRIIEFQDQIVTRYRTDPRSVLDDELERAGLIRVQSLVRTARTVEIEESIEVLPFELFHKTLAHWQA